MRRRAEERDAGPIEPEVPAATTDEPQSEAMAPPEGREAVKKMTHAVDASGLPPERLSLELTRVT